MVIMNHMRAVLVMLVAVVFVHSAMGAGEVQPPALTPAHWDGRGRMVAAVIACTILAIGSAVATGLAKRDPRKSAEKLDKVLSKKQTSKVVAWFADHGVVLTAGMFMTAVALGCGAWNGWSNETRLRIVNARNQGVLDEYARQIKEQPPAVA